MTNAQRPQSPVPKSPRLRRELMRAAQEGDTKTLGRLLDEHPGLAHAVDENGATAAHYAALHGHRAAFALLLEHGADRNRPDEEFGATPGGWAFEPLRQMGCFLTIEIADVELAIERGDTFWLRRFVERFPKILEEPSSDGGTLRQLAEAKGLELPGAPPASDAST